MAKATAREPAQRYQSAAELMRDLSCFLEDRPICSRRVTPAEQTWRWCRRNRILASLASTALALLVLVAVVATIGYVRTSHANFKVTEALAKAETISGLSLQALDEIFERFAPDRSSAVPELAMAGAAGEDTRVPVSPVLSKETAALLEHMLGFYDRLAEAGARDAQLRQKVADANRRVGDIRQRLGQFEQATDAYLHALELYQEIQQERPGDTAIIHELARLHNDIGIVQLARGRPAEARVSFGKALEVSAAITLEATTPAPNRFEVARAYYLLGRRPGRESGPGPPVSVGPPDQRDGDAQTRPSAPPPRADDPDHDPRFGPPPPDPNRQPREQYLTQTAAILEALVEQYPALPEYRLMLARCYREFPLPPSGGAKPPSSDSIDRATAVLQKLAEDYPDVPDYRYELCETLATTRFQGPRFVAEEHPTAEQQLRRALEISQELVREHPQIPEYAAAQIHIRHKLAHVLRETNRPQAAEACLRSALDLQTALARQFPAVGSHRAWQAVVQESLANLLCERGELNEARFLLEASVATLQECLAQEHKSDDVRLLVRNYQVLADDLTRLGEPEEAEIARRQARDLSLEDRPLARP